MLGTPTQSSSRFRAMGSDVHVIVIGGPSGLDLDARARIDQLEHRWSRFLPESELSRLNRADGRPVLVSDDTRVAVAAAVEAWRATDGRFDPTVLAALEASGYDRDFALLEPDPRAVTDDVPMPAPGCREIEIDHVVGAVTLPPGLRIDLGGIGKGLAADLVVDELIAAGADGACVNVGGDLRVRGTAPSADGWVMDVEPMPGLRIALADGAVATSSVSKRRWRREGKPVHHLLDPRDGRPTVAGLVAVTLIASRAVAAEMLTKAAFVAGRIGAATTIERAGATGLLLTDSGEVVRLERVEEYLR